MERMNVDVLVNYALLGVLVGMAFYYDATSMRIPNYLTIHAVWIGIAINFVIGHGQGLIGSIVGTAIGFSSMFILYLCRAVGAGDVKLFAAIGAIIGSEFVLYSGVFSILYAGLLGVIILCIKRTFIEKSIFVIRSLIYMFILRQNPLTANQAQHNFTHFPFMYAVVPGVITTAFQFS